LSRTKGTADCVIAPFLLKGSDRGDTVSTTEYTEKAREEHGTLMTTYLWLKIYAPNGGDVSFCFSEQKEASPSFLRPLARFAKVRQE